MLLELNLPPIHGAQKGINPTLKPESQSKSQQTLAQPNLGTPNHETYQASSEMDTISNSYKNYS